MRIERPQGELPFPTPARLRVGDRFVFLPSVERAIEWLGTPANEALRGRLKGALELLMVAQDSRLPVDLQAGYAAFMDGVARERLIFR